LRLRLLLLSLLVAAPARAYDVEVDSETIGQGYQIAAGDGSLIDRRRLTQYLGLHVWNLGPKDAYGFPTGKNQFYFTSSMRLDTDFGDYPQPGLGTRDTAAELLNNRFDLLWAYLGARDLGGFLDLKLGRQVDLDQFDFVAYDGLSAEARTPYYVAVSAWGGLATNGALPIDSPIYRPDGTSPSVLSVHDGDLKPTVGVALRSFGFRDLDARLSYRHTFSPAQHTLEAERAVHATDGTSEEKLAWSGRLRLFDGLIQPWLGLRFDLLVGVMDHVEAGARVTLSPRMAFSLEYLYAYPTFDGDSIWNLFARQQFDDFRAGYDLSLGRARVSARGFVRLFHDIEEASDRIPGQMPPLAPSSSKCRGAACSDGIDAGGTLGARLDLGRGYLRADGYVDLGYGGRRIGVDASTRMRVYRDLIAVEGRANYVNFQDDLRPLDSGDSFGLSLGARLQLGRGILLHVILEDNVNKFYSSQLRLYAVLDLAFFLGSAGYSQAPLRGIGSAMGQHGAYMGGGY
jgi:hypothetical protein